MDFSTNKEWNGVKLSDQAISTVMVALQKCLLEQSDIVPILRDLKWARNLDTDELHVLNPPTLKFNTGELEEDEN
tara:strand:- start:1940 stop:2164 length:225 start_codon:yes stop_codon:yes gene_type:complete